MKTLSKLKIFVLVFALSIFAFGSLSNVALAQADEQEVPQVVEAVNIEAETVEPLYVSMALSIDANRTHIFATVKNKVTIFSSTVEIYLQLYSSKDYQSSYATMTLESERYSSNLKMGETLEIGIWNYSEPHYWQARIYYKVDNNAWKEQLTNVRLINFDGTVLNSVESVI